ncbi:xylulokinase [Rhodoligotrophos defluvii]|uniref:xylulokinase n=1 Tax=Rhodoligotrophos defluvii TaxID=2561934 RepID=UPI0010C9DABC|nr:FGGY family carbohydrate kinase [Rhodoligotrophos defluvii]
MGRELILAIDAGTSRIRAALFNAKGQCLAQASRPFAVTYQPPLAEADPASLWTAAIEATRALEANPERIAAVAVTAALGMMLVDVEGAPLAPISTWQDQRAAREAAFIESRFGGDAIYEVTGRRIDPELTAPRLMWFREHRPEVFARAHKVLSVKDWLVMRLCGKAVCDPGGASYTLLFDVSRGRWNEELIAALDLSSTLLPEVHDATEIAGSLTRKSASILRLVEGIPVVVGGPDGTVGGIGGGMVEPGIAVNVMGTTDVVLACIDQPCFDAARRLVLNRFPSGQAWSIGGPMAATGGAIAWLAAVLNADLDTLTAEASTVPAGSEGLIFSPILGGSRTPRWKMEERGGMTQLSFEHGRGHVFRAALEGVAVEVAEVFDALEAAGTPVRDIRAVGGGAESRLWLEIRAALLGKPLIVPEVVEASALGAAMLAAVGIGLHTDLRAASGAMVHIRDRIEPSPESAALYARVKRRHGAFRDQLNRRPEPEPGEL